MLPRRFSHALPVACAALLGACGRSETPAPAVASARTAVPEKREAAIRLVPGLRLALVPNLLGVENEDLPGSVRRDVEVLECERDLLRLRWTATVRVEKAESARRREDWARSRANTGPGATPVKASAPEYETRAVSGTLGFPDFGTAGDLLLPGLWPEGSLTLAGTGAIWLSRSAFSELRASGTSMVPFFSSGRLLHDPAAALLRRATELAAERALAGSAASGDPIRWRVRPSASPYVLRVDGFEARVPTLTATNWFGVFEVLADEANPLVLAVLPNPPSSTLLDLFAPANVLKTLLGYRVAAADHGESTSVR